jgi:hypothetical protein
MSSHSASSRKGTCGFPACGTCRKGIQGVTHVAFLRPEKVFFWDLLLSFALAGFGTRDRRCGKHTPWSSKSSSVRRFDNRPLNAGVFEFLKVECGYLDEDSGDRHDHRHPQMFDGV